MPICELLTPRGIDKDTKVALMKKLTAHIEEAYPNMATHIFLQEVDRGDVMFGGAYGREAGKDARVCTIITAPTADADAARKMMAKVNADILEAYASPADLFIIHREDDLGHVMVNGAMGSDNPKYKRTNAAD